MVRKYSSGGGSLDVVEGCGLGLCGGEVVMSCENECT